MPFSKPAAAGATASGAGARTTGVVTTGRTAGASAKEATLTGNIWSWK